MNLHARFLPLVLLVPALSMSAGDGRTLSYAPPEAAGMSAARLERAVALYRDAVARDDIRGAVLLVARHGKIVRHDAVGWRHRGYRLPMERDTLFRMASNTKPVVATAAMILVEEGKLALDDPVSKYFDSFRSDKSRGITLQQLLTHSAGLRIGPIFYPFTAEDGPPTLRGAADKFGREGPKVEPGTTYSYSNAGYNTVGALIEHAAGIPIETFLAARIYGPLGMIDSANHEDPTKLHRMATVYRGRRDAGGKVVFEQGFTPDDPPDFPVIRASGGMISTARDYARFLQMILDRGAHAGGRILSAESVRKATSPLVRIAERDEDGHYGLGWRVASDGAFGHSGSDGTMAWVDPGRDLVGMVLTQSPGGNNPVKEFQKLVAEACEDGK